MSSYTETPNTPAAHLAQGEDKVLIEEVLQKAAHSDISPAAVNKQEALKEPKLRNAVIRRQNGLPPFKPADANANVRVLYHADVIGAIPKG
jgi:hypothetical protein